jgi:hypothetical protein
MIKFYYIAFSSEEPFKFKLKEDVTFKIDKNIGAWKLLHPRTDEILAIGENNVITAKAGYMWDGTTVIGNYYEDAVTLEASLLHDILYNAAKNPEGKKVPFNVFDADAIFKDRLLMLYANNSFFKRKFLPWIYYLGLITVGLPWKLGKNDFYLLKY